jgi:hypothetical protein
MAPVSKFCVRVNWFSLNNLQPERVLMHSIILEASDYEMTFHLNFQLKIYEI